MDTFYDQVRRLEYIQNALGLVIADLRAGTRNSDLLPALRYLSKSLASASSALQYIQTETTAVMDPTMIPAASE